jgi:HTH-type transcriptional regulator/antitoxin HigA
MSDPVADPVPAGQVLAGEIEERGWTQADFADVLGRPTQFVSEIVTGKKEITRESAAQLGAALGTSAEFWLKLQDAYLLNEQSKNAHTQAELDNVRRRARLNKLAPVAALLKRGVIHGRTLDEQEAEIRELFGLRDLSEEPAFVLAARRSNTAEQLSAAQLTWVACVRRSARGHVPGTPFSPAGLARLAEHLPGSLTSPDRFRDLPRMFAESGVVLVYVEALPGAKIDGCALFLDSTPVIGLSGRGKRLDKILFTLLHETAHLALGHVSSDEVVIVDDEQHSGGKREQEANDQAVAWIFPRPIPQPQERINQGWVTQIARERSLAPIVVIGHLQKLERLEWRSTLARNAPTVTDELQSW